MEWILIGIAIAIGFYLAPIVITFVIAVFIGLLGIVGTIINAITGNRPRDN